MTRPTRQTAPTRFLDAETPFPAMAAIKDYVAFYPDRVDEVR